MIIFLYYENSSASDIFYFPIWGEKDVANEESSLKTKIDNDTTFWDILLILNHHFSLYGDELVSVYNEDIFKIRGCFLTRFLL